MPETKIDRYIRELLYDYDCVILPGFGGLVAQAQPANINNITRQIFPPSKKIAFNQNLVHNDGLLASHISRLHACTYADALLQVHRYVNGAKELLQKHNPFSIEGVGAFRVDAEQKILFSPEKSDNFLFESFGLKPVSAIPVVTQLQESKPRIMERPEPEPLPIPEPTLIENSMVENDEVQAPVPQKKRRKRVGIPLVLVSTAVVAFSVLTMYMASNNISVPFLNEGKRQTSSFSNTTYVDTQQMPENATAEEKETQSDEPATATPESAATETPAVKESPAHDATENSELTEGYYVIAGAFRNEENAEKLLSNLKSEGYPEAAYAGHTGSSHLLRVSYLHAASRREAERELRRIRSSGNTEAWILKLPDTE